MIQGNRHLGIILYKRNLYLQLASRWMLQQVSQSVVHLLKGKHFVNTKVKKIFSLASICSACELLLEMAMCVPDLRIRMFSVCSSA